MKKWKLLSSKMAFDNKWFKVQKDEVELPNKQIIDDYYVWLEPNVSMVVPITEDGKIVLVRQYKHGVNSLMIECPAGFADEGESYEETAQRELLEETGYKADTLELLGKLSKNPTKSTGISKIYLARNVKKIAPLKLDDNEEIEVLEITLEEIIKMIAAGEIWATGTVSAIFLVLNKLKYFHEL